MRIAHFDEGLHFDDPNLYWGDPSYLLEPGDPGYVADPTSASFPPTNNQRERKRKMPKSDLIKKPDALFSQQLNTYKNNIGTFAATLGVTAGQMTAQAADADYYAYVLACVDVCNNCSQQWTAWKETLRGGGTVPVGGAPGEPPLPAAVPAVAPGIEARFRALVKLNKAHPNWSTAISEALGTEGEVQSGPDFTTFKPDLKLELSGGNVFVRWGWQNKKAFLDALEIQVDRGTGAGWQLLTIDTTPNYLDTAPPPASAAKWTYRAIFRVGDQRVGQWSDEVNITVAA
ncbi:MAG: hypothetical protein HZA89_05915 [Verrucomicrobia bacterium]|nr:hypothetical protein [Verrucomicrobiota bacterium]